MPRFHYRLDMFNDKTNRSFARVRRPPSTSSTEAPTSVGTLSGVDLTNSQMSGASLPRVDSTTSLFGEKILDQHTGADEWGFFVEFEAENIHKVDPSKR